MLVKKLYSIILVFVCPRKREAGVFKNIYSQWRFWKDEFALTVFTEYVWSVGQTRGKYLRFQTKTDASGLVLSHKLTRLATDFYP